MRDRLRLPRVLRKRKRRKRKRMRRRRKRRSKSGQIVRQEEPPIHLRNCSLSQLLHKRTAVDSCCTLQKQTLRPNRQTRRTANPPQKLLAFPATSQKNRC